MKNIGIKFPALIFFLLYQSVVLWGQETSKSDFSYTDLLNADAPVAITYMITMLIMKITAFILGYLIVKLGHDTLIKGVTGKFDFGFEGSGFKTRLKAATPGTFFVLAGSAIIMWGIFVKKPYDFKISNKPESTQEKKTENTPDESNILVLPD